jgi:nitrate/nitrite transport system substrate-binding protein
MATWILTQMKRWGQIRGDVDYAGVAQQVFLATDAAKAMRELGMQVPASASRTHRIFGRDFDPAQAEAYLNSFAIRRS